MAKRKVVYSQAVIDFIKNSIKKQRLLPGQKVCEQSIASEMSVSRAPVREALNVLLGEGLVISGPHLGKRVTALSVQEIRDVFALGGAMYGVMIAGSMSQFGNRDMMQLEVVRQGFKEQSHNKRNFEEYDKLRTLLHDVLLQYAAKRWDVRFLLYCTNISDCLLYKTHHEVISAVDYFGYTDSILKRIKAGDGSGLEVAVRSAFNSIGERLSVAGYDHKDNANNLVLDKKFYMHKRRQPVIRVAI